jgi:hypothetical protein
MFFLIAAAGGSAFVASYALLHAGVAEMWLRYPLALSIAYALFLALLWLWMKTKPEHYDSAPDLANAFPTRGPSEAAAGASEAGGGAASAVEIGAGALSGELALPLGILLLALALLFSSFYVVYSAPLLFSEILTDALLATALYRRLRRLQSRHWLKTAVRHTALPYVMTLFAVTAVGYALTAAYPDAVTLGDLLR